MKQTCLFGPDSQSHQRRRQERWLGLTEKAQEQLVALLVQLVVAGNRPRDAEEQNDDRGDR